MKKALSKYLFQQSNAEDLQLFSDIYGKEDCKTLFVKIYFLKYYDFTKSLKVEVAFTNCLCKIS